MTHCLDKLTFWIRQLVWTVYFHIFWWLWTLWTNVQPTWKPSFTHPSWRTETWVAHLIFLETICEDSSGWNNNFMMYVVGWLCKIILVCKVFELRSIGTVSISRKIIYSSMMPPGGKLFKGISDSNLFQVQMDETRNFMPCKQEVKQWIETYAISSWFLQLQLQMLGFTFLDLVSTLRDIFLHIYSNFL